MYLSYLPQSEGYFSTYKSQSNCQIFQFQKTIPKCCKSSALDKAVKPLKEAPYDCENTFFNTISFHCFDVHLIKLLSPQFNDQTDSDSLINTIIFHLLSQNLSLGTFHAQKTSDAEKFKKEVLNIFTLTEFDFSLKTEFYKSHTF